jgi:hypothetical protein
MFAPASSRPDAKPAGYLRVPKIFVANGGSDRLVKFARTLPALPCATNEHCVHPAPAAAPGLEQICRVPRFI